MTDDQKRRLRADALLSLEDANDNLNNLRVQALRLSEDLKQVASWIANRANTVPSGADFNPTIEPVRPGTKYQESMDFSALLTLDADLKKARQDVVNAATHKKMLDESRSGTIRLA